jgi:hypothetical protein
VHLARFLVQLLDTVLLAAPVSTSLVLVFAKTVLLVSTVTRRRTPVAVAALEIPTRAPKQVLVRIVLLVRKAMELVRDVITVQLENHPLLVTHVEIAKLASIAPRKLVHVVPVVRVKKVLLVPLRALIVLLVTSTPTQNTPHATSAQLENLQVQVRLLVVTVMPANPPLQVDSALTVTTVSTVLLEAHAQVALWASLLLVRALLVVRTALLAPIKALPVKRPVAPALLAKSPALARRNVLLVGLKNIRIRSLPVLIAVKAHIVQEESTLALLAILVMWPVHKLQNAPSVLLVPMLPRTNRLATLVKLAHIASQELPRVS